jgi:hypothetical protein
MYATKKQSITTTLVAFMIEKGNIEAYLSIYLCACVLFSKGNIFEVIIMKFEETCVWEIL